LVKWRFGMVRDQLFPPDGKIRVPIRLKITENEETKLRNYEKEGHRKNLCNKAAYFNWEFGGASCWGHLLR